MRHIAKYVRETSGGERARHMTAKRPPGMVRLDMGTPSFPTPAHICQAAKDALDQGLTAYAPGQGDPEFLQAVQETVARDMGADYPLESIIATHGASSGIYAALTTFLDPGDEVLLLDPTYSLYAHVARQLGAVPVMVPRAADYHVDMDAMRAAVSPRSRMILINNPDNPTGVVLRREEIAALAELCAERDLMLVADEAYEKLLQPGYAHVPLLSLTEHRERLILLHTLSKSYAMTGWRVGYMVVPEDLHQIVFSAHRSMTGPVGTFTQRAGATALRGPQECVAQMRAEYQNRGALMHRLAREVPGLVPLEPQGAFYLYCRYELPLPAAEVHHAIWEAGVAARSGTEYGPSGEGHLRFTYAVSEPEIEKGMGIVKEVFRQLG